MKPPGLAVDSLTLLALTAFAGWVVVQVHARPHPVPAGAPSGEFSAERAHGHLAMIGQAPRRLHQPYYERSREYVIARLAALGFATEIQATTAHHATAPVFFSSVQNLVARIDGASGARDAVLLVAHYDSEPFVSPGVRDNAAAVAVLLEVARAVATGPRPDNTIILLFTSPEESATEGAVAFVTEHRWARDVRVVVNVEFGDGPIFLLATSEENGWLIRQLAAGAPGIIAHAPITRLNPAPTTDFGQAFRPAGLTGIDLSGLPTIPAAGAFRHSRRDDLAHVRLSELQAFGQQILALTRRLGDADLGEVREPNRIYFRPLDGIVVHYPVSWSGTLAALGIVLLAAVAVVGARRRLLRWRGVAAAVLAVGTAFAAVLLGTVLLWRALARWHPLHQFLFNQTEYHRLPIFLAFTGLTALLTLGVFLLVAGSRRATFLEVTTGVAGSAAVAGAVGTVAMPELAYYLVWSAIPLLVATLAALLAHDPAASGWTPRQGVLFGVAGMVAVALVLPLVLASAASRPTDLLRHVASAWLFVLLIPLMRDLLVRRPVPVLGLVGAATLVPLLFAVSRGFGTERPRVAHVWLVQDADRGTAFWAARNLYRGPVDSYTAQFVGPGRAVRRIRDVIPDYPNDYEALIAPAPVPMAEPPALELLGDSMVDGVRTLRIRIATRRGAYEITGYRSPQLDLVDYEVNGLAPAPLLGREAVATDSTVLFHFRNVPAEGFVVTLRVRQGMPVEIKLRDRTFGLPLIGRMEPMPEHMIPLVDYGGGSVVVIKTFRL